MEPPIPPAEAWWDNSFMVTFEFRCNLACTFCMVEDVLDVYPGTSLAAFEAAAADPGLLEGKTRIIFSGGEVTLSPQLVDYVRLARSLPGIEHVRLQTNAVRLNRADVLDALIDAGVDELFVSVHGHDAALCDALTQRKGSFEAIRRGLSTIAASRATLITNTAIVEPNHRHLADIVELVSPYGPRSMEFWNYWPRADEDGSRGHAARVGDIRAPLLRALETCVDRGIPPVVKWVPRCLLGDMAWCQDDGQPPAILEDTYFERAPEYACLYQGVCADAVGKCSGLSHQYIRHFGWEHELLTPRRTRAPGTERGDIRRSLTQDPVGSRQGGRKVAEWLSSFGLTHTDDFGGYRIVDAGHTPDRRELSVRLEGGGAPIEARIRPRDPSRRCFARTRSFDVLTRRTDVEPPAREALRLLAKRIASADPGGLALPG